MKIEERHRKAAKRLVYSVRGWQQRSSAFCVAMTEKWAQIIADCEEDLTTSGRSGDVARAGHGTGGRRTTGACNAQAVPSVQQPPASPTNSKVACEVCGHWHDPRNFCEDESIASDPLAVAVRMERAEAEVARLREALSAAVPFLFEHGRHVEQRCYRSSDDECYCGLDEAKKFVEAALGKDGQ